MKKTLKTVLIAAVAVVVLGAAVVVRTYYTAGQFKTIEAHYNGTCTGVDGMPSPGSVTIEPQTGLAFVSASDARNMRAGKKSRGDIYSFDFKTKGAVPKKLTGGFEKEFHPDGISIYREPDSGKMFVFAVNHTIVPKETEYVEIFEYVNGLLEHRETIFNDDMYRPFDIVAVGPRSFYVTNHHGTRRSQKIMRLLETYVPLKRAYVLLYDGKEMRKVAENIGLTDGIAMSTDGQTMYVAATLENAIKVYKRDAATGNLTPSFDIPLGTMPDKIRLDANGNLYVAAHPKVLSRLAHVTDAKNPSPSQVLKISIKGFGNYKVEEIYLNSGSEISVAGVAVPIQGGMLLGAERDDLMLVCTAK